MPVSATMGVMRPLLGKLAALAGEEYSKLKGVKKQASFLEKELSAMNAALEKMELMDELDPVSRDWRDHVREMSFDMENCINDFMRQFGGGHVKVGFIKKTAQRLKWLGRQRHRIADRMEELKVLALEANDRRIRYSFDECNPNSSLVSIDPRMSAIYVETTGLVGNDGPREKLVNLLTDTEENLKVVSILGFGGLGKTTLAKEVYNQIWGKFDCKAFVPVSQKPNMVGLLNRLQLKLGMEGSSQSCVVDDIIDDLREYLIENRKRYLVVIDDLWDQSKWYTISRAFPENANGSRVIVTTRVEDVACGACYSRPECIYRMKPLDEKDSKKLFFRRVYGSEDDHPSQLEEISTEILKKCGGLPLAIITIASLLASRPERLRDEWEIIRNSLGTQFAVNPTLEGMRSILNLSYIHLPVHLRACFMHLGIYPEDSEIERDDLVRQWLAERFVSNLHGQDMEVVAKSYFNELVNRSLIQPQYTDYGELLSCRVHDMMLDLIQSKCGEHNFVRFVCNSEDMKKEHGWKYKVRRISMNLSAGDARDETTSGTIPFSMSQVRSLAHFGGSKYMPHLLHFKYLRVIRISGELFDTTVDLTAISQLCLLRYLKVSVKRYISLPTEMQGLTELPKGVRNMKSLCTLDGFELRHRQLEDIEGLAELTNLRCLRLFGVSSIREEEVVALASSIGMLHDLTYLQIDGSFFDTSNLLGSLSDPSHHIKVLIINEWRMPRVPKWICGLQCLSWLDLKVGTCTDEFHALGELPSLVQLSLWLDIIPEDSVVIFSAGSFPVLQHCECNSEYDVTAYLVFAAGAMPKLRILRLQFDDGHWGGAAPVGLEHLLSLERIDASVRSPSEYLKQIISAFWSAIKLNPNRPSLNVGRL
ncbi:disease resistance protein RGA5-like [Triticum aestivum]|uniref:disease resistance protein RGA5-like n=1 Tax=Triticum aestivum TaxID=4565 RepID=UPI001D0210D2|nr:disease resistance protein RGA5-like [Triticum aestivum]